MTIVLWLVVCAISLYTLWQSNGNNIENIIGLSKSTVQSNLLHQVEKTKAELYAMGLDTLTRDNLMDCLEKLRQHNNGAPVYTINLNGELKDINGVQGSLGSRPETSAGYALAELPDPRGYMLLIMPMKDGRHIARGYTRQALCEVIASDIGVEAEKITLFDENEKAIWTYDKADTLGGRQQNANPQKLDILDVRLAAPDGWVMRLELPKQVLQPFMDYRLLLPGMLVISIGLAVMLRYYRRLWQFKSAMTTELYEKDQLTGLFNREGLEVKYNFMAKAGQLKGYTMVCMDIMGFSHFNSIFGYEKGDKLLCAIADGIGEHCLASRSHGDMFTILLPPERQGIERLDEQLHKAIKQRLRQNIYQLITIKYGICAAEEGGFSDVQDRAMLALAEAKDNSGRQYVIFNDNMQKQMDSVQGIENNMSKALDREELEIYIQPIVATADESCIAGEMLVRWKSPEIGFLDPEQFIPYFEQNCFITELDLFMLDKAFNLICRWRKEFGSNFRLSVNFSQVSLAFPNYIQRMAAVAANYPDVPNENISIEVTEGTLGGNSEVLTALARLREMGFIISMDDFGTGYSSLIKLKELPIDVLKLDRGFLNELIISDKSEKIIRHITNMADELGIMTICEGVETSTHLDFVKRLGCTAIQGYYFSRPLPWDIFEETYIAGKAKAMRGSKKQQKLKLVDGTAKADAASSLAARKGIKVPKI